MAPKISVIIPVYNTEKYLSACLDSVLQQTVTDLEIICVDDGSTDTCPRILQDYGKKDARISVFTQSNQKQGVARNKALDKVQGEYIFFLDSDDTLPEYALETLLKIAEEANVPVVASESYKKGDKKFPFNYRLFHHPLADLIKNRHIFSGVPNKLYRADILKTHRFVPGIYFEDWPFLTTLFGQIDSFATTKTPCYFYTDNNSSTIRSAFTMEKVDSYLTGIRYVYDFYKDRPDLNLAQKRMAVAVKMMVNKVYKTKDKELIHYTLSALNDLFEKGIIKKFQLPLKTLFRLWKMRRMK